VHKKVANLVQAIEPVCPTGFFIFLTGKGENKFGGVRKIRRFKKIS
jgi:hypothetical protein